MIEDHKEKITDLSFLKNKKPNHKNDRNMSYEEYYYSYLNPPNMVLRLSFELNTDQLSPDEKTILKSFGMVDKGITRDIYVPGDITLNALSCLIQKVFGWQNMHPHCFRMSDKSFQKITGGKNEADKTGFVNYDGKITDWVKLCGMYFRYPADEPDGIYQDDNYKEFTDFESWAKERYIGPYIFNDEREKYRVANKAAKNMLKRMSVVSVNEDIHNSINGETALTCGKYIEIPVEDATIMDFQCMGKGRYDQLLERQPVSELLIPYGVYLDEDAYEIIEDESNNPDSLHILDDVPAVPVTYELIYEYDYGNGWEVRINMTECYKLGVDFGDDDDFDDDDEFDDEYDDEEYDDVFDDEEYDEKTDSNYFFISIFDPDKMLDEETEKFLKNVLYDETPVCVAADGLPVMDDVGGIQGYVDYLNTINTGSSSEKQEYLEWGKKMGWTGRMSKPENVL